jgi:hypothetical protein
VHTDMRRTGSFTCSDDRINALHEAAVWSLRGNACDIPTDCPHRERAGWTGDWQLYVATAAFLYDVAGFSAKWLRDVAADQWDDGTIANISPSTPAEGINSPVSFLNGSAGWGDAIVIVPWEIYRAYGDEQLLAELWPSMVRWLDRTQRTAAAARHPSRTGLVLPHERYLWDTGFHWGEWLEPGDDMSGSFEDFASGDKSDVATAYYARSAELMSRIATVLRRGSDAARYADLAVSVRAAWQAEFIAAGGDVRPATQATIARALTFGLLPEHLRERAAAQLVRLIRDAGTHLGTGFLATPDLLPALAEAGHADLAYELLLQDTPPSWLGMIAKGATTVWERWEGIDDDGVPHESLNHYSKGAVISFLHRYTAGIRIGDEPAYRTFRIQPVPGGRLTSAAAAHESPYGRIESSWTVDRGLLRLDVTVPPGTTAEVVLPGRPARHAGPGRHSFQTLVESAPDLPGRRRRSGLRGCRVSHVEAEPGPRDVDPAAVGHARGDHRRARVGARPQVSQRQSADACPRGLRGGLVRAGQVAGVRARHPLRVGRLGDQEIGSGRQLGHGWIRTAVTGVDDHLAAGLQSHPGVGNPVRQQPGSNGERAHRQRLVRLELVQGKRVVEHAGPVKREDGVQGRARREDGQRRRRIRDQGPGPKQGVEIGAVVGMSMADQDGVDLAGWRRLQQPWQRRVARVEQQTESLLLDQESAACRTGRGPGSATAENGDPHSPTIPDSRR